MFRIELLLVDVNYRLGNVSRSSLVCVINFGSVFVIKAAMEEENAEKGSSKSRPVYGKAGHMACTLTRGAYLIHTFA